MPSFFYAQTTGVIMIVFSSYRKAKEWAIDNLEGGWTITRYQLDKNYREVMEDRD